MQCSLVSQPSRDSIYTMRMISSPMFFTSKLTWTPQLQPPIMPRPDVAAIGTSYRRIPVLSCGLDIYNDTRLILSKLNTLYPPSSAHPSISASTEEQKGIEKLLEFWAVHGLFTKAAALIPSEMPLLKDEKFRKDREDYTGTSWQPENLERGRSEALVEVRNAFELLETTLLADGREWILKTENPSLGDIEGMLHSLLNNFESCI